MDKFSRRTLPSCYHMFVNSLLQQHSFSNKISFTDQSYHKLCWNINIHSSFKFGQEFITTSNFPVLIGKDFHKFTLSTKKSCFENCKQENDITDSAKIKLNMHLCMHLDRYINKHVWSERCAHQMHFHFIDQIILHPFIDIWCFSYFHS